MGDGHLRADASNSEDDGGTSSNASSSASRRAISIIGCRVDHIDGSATIETLAAFCQEDRPRLVVTADSSMLVRAQTDRELHTIIQTADLVVPDSIGVIWASRFLGTPLPERVPGVDLVERLCAYCAKAGFGVYFLGSAPGVAEIAAEQLQQRHPGLLVVGHHHGYFNESEEPAVLEHIRQAQPHVLFAAMGIPRQEKWLSQHLPHLPVRLGIGVGGSLDVMAGKVKRAPAFFRRTNLEWLYRVASDPRRLRKGALLPIFVFLTFQYRFLRPQVPKQESR